MPEVLTPNFDVVLMPDNPLTPDAIFNQFAVVWDLLAPGVATNYTATPPGSPANGDVYIVAAGGTGAFSGQDEKLALYYDGWVFFPAPRYFALYVSALNQFYRKGVSLWSLDTIMSSVGKHTIGVPSGALIPATTNGCALAAQAETTTHKINYKYLAFDPTAIEYASFSFPSPKSWNASTFKARFLWTHPATATNFGVVWQIELLSLGDGDAIDTAWGTAVTVTDTGGTTEDFYTSPETAAITASNTPAKQDWIMARVSRKATEGADTMTVDAYLLGVEIYYYTDASVDD